ncbi:hypothetical protein H696_03688 [Fonticula alba]|uniref:Uncharacterized protein n=1 Tax=Fonticula alba TaxID=691883 RepID=A0A058Z552_FONAL|nr:hypothetical protein H696_03688 [Fonticula alba]KCV69261.1 hypothetical protein H696_03688 [Fonticula alba]|eukprot:XP_009495826.1 hypothetical protein H696_03688 [Fonticula alba]
MSADVPASPEIVPLTPADVTAGLGRPYAYYIASRGAWQESCQPEINALGDSVDEALLRLDERSALVRAMLNQQISDSAEAQRELAAVAERLSTVYQQIDVLDDIVARVRAAVQQMALAVDQAEYHYDHSPTVRPTPVESTYGHGAGQPPVPAQTPKVPPTASPSPSSSSSSTFGVRSTFSALASRWSRSVSEVLSVSSSPKMPVPTVPIMPEFHPPPVFSAEAIICQALEQGAVARAAATAAATAPSAGSRAPEPPQNADATV